MSKKINRKFDIDEYRQGIITSLSVLKSDVRNTRETLTDLRSLLREQNSRIRKNEKSISKIFGMGSVIMAGFSALIAWLFNK
jgi:hypothetical protein